MIPAPTHPLARALALALAVATALAACTVDRSRSPVCGMALLVGPNLILQQLGEGRGLLSDAPRGLPATLPVRVTAQADTGRGRVVDGKRDTLLLQLDQELIPRISVDSASHDSTVYGVLLVDDSTSIVQGVLVFERPRPPAEFPRVGTLADPQRAVPLYGLRVNWASLSNPRCPLFGGPTP